MQYVYVMPCMHKTEDHCYKSDFQCQNRKLNTKDIIFLELVIICFTIPVLSYTDFIRP